MQDDSLSAEFRNFAYTVAVVLVCPSIQPDLFADIVSQVPPEPQPALLVIYISLAPPLISVRFTVDVVVYEAPPAITMLLPVGKLVFFVTVVDNGPKLLPARSE